MVVGFGAKAVGQREVRGLQVGASEAEPFWIELMRGLNRQGLRGVKLVASAWRQAHDLGADHFQKSTVAGVGYDLLLHRGVHDHPLQISLLDRTHCHSGFDGALKRVLYASFTQALAGQAEFGLVASESGLKVFLATEKLKLHVLAQRSITAKSLGLYACLRHSRTTFRRIAILGGRADTCVDPKLHRTKQVRVFHSATRPFRVGEPRG